MTLQQILVLFALSVIPALLILRYYLRQDSVNDREPRRLLWRVFRWGMVVVFAAGIIEILTEGVLGGEAILAWNPLVYFLLFTALLPAVVEESLKLWVIKSKIYTDPSFSEPMDGIMYTVVASLGFAALENVFYILSESDFSAGLLLGGFRAVMSVPGHALFSGLMGYYIGKSKFCGNPDLERELQRKGLMLAIFFHALFNFSVSFGTQLNPLLGLGAALLVIIGLFRNLRGKIGALRGGDANKTKLPNEL